MAAGTESSGHEIHTAPALETRRADLDAVRTAAMVAVVAIHVLAASLGLARGPWSPLYLVVDKALNWVAVPTFLFLTGMLVWNGPAPASAIRWWRRRLGRVFVPFLVWSALYMLLRFALAGRSSPPLVAALPTGPGSLALALLFGGGFYHLYFPPLLIVVYLLAPVARRVRAVSPWLLLAAAPLLQLAFAYGWQLAAPLPDWRSKLANLALLAPFAAVGAWYGALEPQLRPWRPVVLSAGAVGLAVVLGLSTGALPLAREPFPGVLPRLGAMLSASAVIAAAVMLASAAAGRLEPRRALYHRMSGLSYGVYLAHPMVIVAVVAMVRNTLGDAVWAQPAFVAAAFAVVLAATIGLVSALDANRWTEWAV